MIKNLTITDLNPINILRLSDLFRSELMEDHMEDFNMILKKFKVENQDIKKSIIKTYDYYQLDLVSNDIKTNILYLLELDDLEPFDYLIADLITMINRRY